MSLWLALFIAGMAIAAAGLSWSDLKRWTK